MCSEHLFNMYISVSHQQTRSRKLSTLWLCAAHQQCICLELGSCFLSGYIFGSSRVIYGCKEFSQKKVTPHLGSSPVPWLEAKSILSENAKSIPIDSKWSKEVSEFQLYNIATSMKRKVTSHQHNLTTQSLNNHLGIGEDHDVSHVQTKCQHLNANWGSASWCS
jgi:hypothetical protein